MKCSKTRNKKCTRKISDFKFCQYLLMRLMIQVILAGDDKTHGKQGFDKVFEKKLKIGPKFIFWF
jgi:hypothetical protein